MIKYENGRAKDVKITFIGGGSRGWAWVLMGDLAKQNLMSGEVCLYGRKLDTPQLNVQVAENLNALPECQNKDWHYYAEDNLDKALQGADFVFISILPGTFDDMDSDLHTPNKWNVWQTMGDSCGPGGVLRALRFIPIFENFADKIAENCPDAWVGNLTNPMAACTAALVNRQPKLKVFGCCHEVFATQNILAQALREKTGIEATREEIKVEVTGLNHFTWVTKANYKNIDLYPLFYEYMEQHKAGVTLGVVEPGEEIKAYRHLVQFDLSRAYSYIAAAGDRHLVEFCGDRYLSDVETLNSWGIHITTVDWRRETMEESVKRQHRMASGEERFDYEFDSGENTVDIMAALLGLIEYNTNLNLVNVGQIPSAPLGIAVETNATICAGKIVPNIAHVPSSLQGLFAPHFNYQQLLLEAVNTRSVKPAFQALCSDPLVLKLSHQEIRDMFGEMIENTKGWLTAYDLNF